MGETLKATSHEDVLSTKLSSSWRRAEVIAGYAASTFTVYCHCILRVLPPDLGISSRRSSLLYDRCCLVVCSQMMSNLTTTRLVFL